MNKLHLPTIQLVLLDGAHDPTASQVLKFITARIKFGDLIHYRPSGRPFNYDQAMEFQAKRIGDLLPDRLTHQLSIECDGFPVHTDRWNDNFLEWDYIGAPWPKEITIGQVRVGNGGCALRSRSFIEVAKRVAYVPGMAGDVWWCQYRPVIRAMRKAGV